MPPDEYLKKLQAANEANKNGVSACYALKIILSLFVDC